MIVGKQNTEFKEFGANNESTSFSIKASSVAFKILSSGLYKDKPLAIVRELSCNALDAHKMIGNKEQFEVELPTNIKPWLTIRDFGPGLSKDDVQHLYTTYFQSTKNESNEFIGGLGLGSKSPFAYTDTFNIESRFNGKAYQYIAFIDNSGMPNIRLLGEKSTKEKNGLTVTVPVESKDIHLFVKAAENVFYAFDIVPKVFHHNIEMGEIENIHSNCDYSEALGVFINSKYSRSWHYFAKYGNILYPIDLKLIPYGSEFSKFCSRFLDMKSIYFEFELGELDITASREELSYDKDTIKKIDERLKKFVVDYLKELEKDLNKLEDIERVYSTMINMNIFKQVDNLCYKGKTISDWRLEYQHNMQQTLEKIQKSFVVPSVETILGKKFAETKQPIPDSKKWMFQLENFYNRGNSLKSPISFYPSLKMNVVLIDEKNTKKIALKKCKDLSKNVLCIDTSVFKIDVDKVLSRNLFTVYKTSDIKKQEQEKTTQKKEFLLRKLKGFNHSGSHEVRMVSESEFKDKSLFVLANGNKLVFPDEVETPIYEYYLLECIINGGINVFVCPKGEYKKIVNKFGENKFITKDKLQDLVISFISKSDFETIDKSTCLSSLNRQELMCLYIMDEITLKDVKEEQYGTSRRGYYRFAGEVNTPRAIFARYVTVGNLANYKKLDKFFPNTKNVGGKIRDFMKKNPILNHIFANNIDKFEEIKTILKQLNGENKNV